MQISLSFNPVEDKHEHVNAVVDAVYGVKSSPKQTAPAATQATVQTTAAVEPSQLSPVNSPAPVAEFPNPSIAPTVAALINPVTSSPAGVDLDKNGIPWDVRIHSGGLNDDGSHKKNKDGSWAKKKGVSDLDISTITKELQNLMAAQVGHAAPPAGLPAGGVLGNPVNVPHQEVAPLPNDPNAFIVIQPNTIVQPAPLSAPVTPEAALVIAPMPMSEPPTLAPQVAPMPLPIPQPAAAPTDYNSLAVWLAPNLEESGGKLKREHVAHFCKQCNIVNAQGEGEFALVAKRPDAVAWLYQAFTAQIAATV